MMDYIPVASLVIADSAVLILSCRQRHRHIDADERCTPATLASASNQLIVGLDVHKRLVDHKRTV